MKHTKYTREYFNDTVVILRKQKHLDELLSDLRDSEKLNDSKLSEITVKKFPMIVYQGRFKSIDISEIDESAVLQLKYDPDFNRRVIEKV